MSSIGWQQLASGRDNPTAGTRIATTVILLLFVAAATFSGARKHVTQGFDELAHVSYVAEMQHRTIFWPRLENLRLLDAQSFRFTPEANYLNHPPFYYALLAAVGPNLEGHPAAAFMHRLLNVAIAAIGLAAALAIGLFGGFERRLFYAYAVPLACIPVLAPLAGAVNPDNMAFAGGAATMLAAWMLVATGRNGWLAAALCAALVASWAKLTGLLLAGGFLTVTFIYLVWRGRFPRRWIVPLILAALLAAAPYVILTLQYGGPAPNTPAQLMLLESGARATGWAELPRLAFGAYVLHFIADFVAGWMPALAARSAWNYAALFFPLAALACALAGFAVSLRRLLRQAETALDVVVVSGLLASGATLACNIVFSYGRHLATGWMMDAYPRYYLPLAAAVPLAALSLVSAIEHPRWRNAAIVFLIANPLIFRVLGGPLG
ncbi:MAG TPA: hypothetical protein VFA53_01005 [Xanthobacteraceae bacterium]|nr:hypothetical protein [Xanthobacteraceae bacterium]